MAKEEKKINGVWMVKSKPRPQPHWDAVVGFLNLSLTDLKKSCKNEWAKIPQTMWVTDKVLQKSFTSSYRC